MKVKVLSNFRWKDEKKGLMLDLKKDEEMDFDLSDSKAREEFYLFLQARRVLIIDSKYVPLKAEYECVFSIGYVVQEVPKQMTPKNIYTLDQGTAGPLLVTGHIRPTDKGQWTPKRLLSFTSSEGKPRAMFDMPEEKKGWTIRERSG